MDSLLADSVDKLLAGCCSAAVVREVERTRNADALWAQIEGSGFLDTLVPEAAGGAGLGLRDAFAVFEAAGRHAVPVPLAHTMLLRAALAQGGQPAPSGALAIAAWARQESAGSVACQAVPFGAVASHVLVLIDGTAWLLDAAQAERRATGVHGSLQAHLQWPSMPAGALRLAVDWPWLHIGAALTAAMMSGAMSRVLELSLAHANTRAQFGKSIGKFQAVQQQLSVMAEQVFAARMAAQLGCASHSTLPRALAAAAAKARAGDAAQQVVAIAHAVHGAIGITADHDLQLFTRRLQEWRSDFASSPYWHAQLGAALLGAASTPAQGSSTLQFLLTQFDSEEPHDV